MNEGLVYKHTVEAFVNQVIVGRGLLSLEFDRKLRELNLDVRRPRELDLQSWCAVLKVCAAQLNPGRSEDDALREIGRAQLQAYRDSLVGRAIFMAVRLRGPRRALLRLMDNYRTADNITQITINEQSPTRFELTFNTTGGVPNFVQGILLEFMTLAGAQAVMVDFSVAASGVTIFIVEWAPSR